MTTTTPTTSEPSPRELCLFLAEYAGWLLGSGATCIRLEKNVTRMARAFGREVELTISLRHVHVSLIDPGHSELCTTIASARPAPVSFRVITDLSRLSWEVADGKTSFADARISLVRITTSGRQNPAVELLLVALANASFCRLFGGDAMAMLVVGCATAAGYLLKQRLLAVHADVRVVMLLCAFVSSVLGATDGLFALGSTPAVSVGTSILYLVPGIPYLNSFSDMLYRYYICSMSRFMDALVLTCCLSAGLCAGILLTGEGGVLNNLSWI